MPDLTCVWVGVSGGWILYSGYYHYCCYNILLLPLLQKRLIYSYIPPSHFFTFSIYIHLHIHKTYPIVILLSTPTSFNLYSENGRIKDSLKYCQCKHTISTDEKSSARESLKSAHTIQNMYWQECSGVGAKVHEVGPKGFNHGRVHLDWFNRRCSIKNKGG